MSVNITTGDPQRYVSTHINADASGGCVHGVVGGYGGAAGSSGVVSVSGINGTWNTIADTVSISNGSSWEIVQGVSVKNIKPYDYCKCKQKCENHKEGRINQECFCCKYFKKVNIRKLKVKTELADAIKEKV